MILILKTQRIKKKSLKNVICTSYWFRIQKKIYDLNKNINICLLIKNDYAWVKTRIILNRENYYHCITSNFDMLDLNIFSFWIHLLHSIIVIFPVFFSFTFILQFYTYKFLSFLLLISWKLSLYHFKYKQNLCRFNTWTFEYFNTWDKLIYMPTS